jgi:uncharacterized repeat protein (TIGR03803 family)
MRPKPGHNFIASRSGRRCRSFKAPRKPAAKKKIMKPTRFLVLAMALFSLSSWPVRATFTLSTLYAFTSSATSGENPYAPLELANDGNFYGTTESGGANTYYGTVFRMTPGGTVTVLFSFNYGNGGIPIGGLRLGQNGNLYGTTSYGGASGDGTVFQITTNGVLTTLFSFNGANGSAPYGRLTQGTDGNFYGTTSLGGTAGAGTVFRVTPAGGLRTLASFNRLNGSNPYAGMIQGADGNFYGTTTQGGSYGQGTIFEMTPEGNLVTLAVFSNGGGFSLQSLVQNSDGSFYGAGTGGGGSGNGFIFKLDSKGVFTNLFSFQGTNGSFPYGGLALGLDGNFYGTTEAGGTNGDGSVFQIRPDGTFTKLAEFGVSPGAAPFAAPVQGADGNLYGTTADGGVGNYGTLYRLTITNLPLQITSQPQPQSAALGANVKISVATLGNFPLSYQWLRNGIPFTDGGNLSGSKTRVLTWTSVSEANAGVYSVIVSNSFGAVTSAPALFEVVVSPPFITAEPADQTVLPGAAAMFRVAAEGDMPLFYQWQKNGINLTDGGNISGSTNSLLMLSDVSAADQGAYSVVVSNELYADASCEAVLTLVPTVAPGITFTTLHSFSSSGNGVNPHAGLTQSSRGPMYGTTESGGTAGDGTVFSITTNGTFSVIVGFNGNNAQTPEGPLIQATDGNLYGTSLAGGTALSGVVFRVTSLNLVGTLHSFAGAADGSNPYAGLQQGTDGALYGTATYGGLFSAGTIFKMTTSGLFTSLYSFTNAADGGEPYAGLVQANDRNFYGTTSAGGTNNNGTIFKITTNGGLSTLYWFTGTNDGASPRAALIQARDGNLYGTAYEGGTAGSGTIFRVSTNGVFNPLFQFNGTNGARPYGGLLQASDGNFYGTTENGGVGGVGSIFRMDTNGNLTTLVWFNEANGATPEGTLIQGADGALYGTTYHGGTSDNGTVFKLVVPLPPLIIHQPTNQPTFQGATVRFTVVATGVSPLSYQWQVNGTNLTDGDGITGSTNSTLSISNTSPAEVGYYSVIVSNALGSVTSVGAQLSIASAPPTIISQSSSQTVPSGATVILSVTVLGNQPLFYQWQDNGTALADGNNLTGTGTASLTIKNVSAFNNGTYSVTVSNVLGWSSSTGMILTVTPVTIAGVTLKSLNWPGQTNDGLNPNGLVQGSDGLFYGTTQNGGANTFGTIFQMTASGVFTNLYSFTGLGDGAYPVTSLIQGTNGNFYGTASAGGGGWGTLFEISPVGGFNTWHTFGGGVNGGFPSAGLVRGKDGDFYGTTLSGGTNQGWGTAFKIGPDGTFNSLHSFSGGNDGGSALGNLAWALDGNLYGSTSEGGGGYGTVFRLSSQGALTPIHAFANSDGEAPYGGVIQANDGNLYGTTAYGGLSDYGTVFKMTTNGGITTLYLFSGGNDGSSPYAGLLQASDGNFYGTTEYGGADGDGTVFQITTNGTLTTLAWFDGFNGANPEATLIQSADGSLYGTTQNGGVDGNGVVFRLTTPSLVPSLAFRSSALLANHTQVALTWITVAGQTYQLQYVADLKSTNWINLGNPILATNAWTTTSDSVGLNSQRFYRVVLAAP